MEYYDEATLDKIADELGKRLKVDNKTVISARGSYARIYVELDLSKPLEPSVAVGKFDYMLEYEHIHLICFSCGRVGHRKEACLNIPTAGGPANSSNMTVETGAKSDTGNVKFNGQLSDNGPGEIGFGEWMIVNRKPRWSNRPPGPSNSQAQPHGFKYRNNNQHQLDSDRAGPSKVQNNGPTNKRGLVSKNAVSQNSAPPKPTIPKPSSDPKGSRCNSD